MSCTTSIHHHIALSLTCTGLMVAGAALADDAPAAPAFTGHIDLVSSYVVRGQTTSYLPSGLQSPRGGAGGNANADAAESENPALQWGVDWTSPSGLYLGYWASTIGYSYKKLGDMYSTTPPAYSDFRGGNSVENDLYGGYNGKLGNFGYTLGLTGYVYLNGTHANALETKIGGSYGDFSAYAQTLLNDVTWGNEGDTYWTLNYTHALPYDITFNSTLGFYTYTQNGKYLGNTNTLTNTACAAGTVFDITGGCVAGTTSSGNFRHLTLGITQPIGKSGMTWGLQGIIGGENRFNVKQDNKLIASISYGF